MPMQRLFKLMQEQRASDMFFAVNSPIHLKINGELVPINDQKLEWTGIRALLSEVVTPADMQKLATENELNIGIPAAGVGRFRLSAFCQRGSISAVFRYIPSDIPDLNVLNLPTTLTELVTLKHGLILVAGATGSGKSTTIAAMLDRRNASQTGHILTLEDPIEYLFRSKKSIVNQREIGADTASLNLALKNALRQAPDCILIGEIRDKETMSAAIAYAQSGHLVLATLHANNSYNALNRIISFYPIETRQSLLQDLSSTIRAIICQRLIRCTTGGRVPAVEVMRNTQYVAELIEKGEIDAIRDAIEKSLSPGSQTFELALIKLIREGMITREDALLYADSATNLMWHLNNGQQESGKLFQKQDNEVKPKIDNSADFAEFTMKI
ncbi:MAG: PilT/PilU family type 4a pilus ATPase [Burkholderiaceae bacterium]|nr:PilT/PilU family type 4a pilus ATPase [Burkholderiaceae bacterium]